MPKNVLIIGMPRSGTSMATSIFVKKGYFVTSNLDKELRPGDEHNPSGYWEAEPLVRCNCEILNAATFEYDNTWLFEPITDTQAKNILNLTPAENHKNLVDDYERHSPWVWKDPRLCYTLGYWWPLLDKDNTKVLLLIRDPKEIYQSFIRLKWRPIGAKAKEDVYSRTRAHIRAARKIIHEYKIPHIVVNYSDFGSAPEETANRISRFLEFELNAIDIPYSNTLNHSNLSGKLSTVIDLIAEILPGTARKTIKSLIPKFIFRIIFPYRNK